MGIITRRYYSQRKRISQKLDIDDLKELFCLLIKEFSGAGFFAEYFGYHCIDGDSLGMVGDDIEGYIYLKIRKKVHWPIDDDVPDFDEDTLFDLIEFLHDTISHPVDKFYHSYNNCGWHYTSFNQDKGQRLFRDRINELLINYAKGFFLAESGEIEMTHTPELNKLMENDLPHHPGEELQIKERVDLAIAMFRDRHSTFTERQSAVRELANVLEHILPLIQESMLTKKDERDLFNIANNFCIRHNDKGQKNDYSVEWLCWIFHVYLATIHLCLWVRERDLNDKSE